MSINHAVTMAQNRNFRMAAVEATPELIFADLYNRFLTGEDAYLKQCGGMVKWKLQTPEKEYALVRAKDALRITHIGDNPRRRVYEKYTMDGFQPSDGDTVIDVGAFIGEFSWQVATEHNVEITALEPDPRSSLCAQQNTPSNVEVVNAAVGPHDGKVKFNIAESGDESGILTPDKGTYEEKMVEMQRLDTITDSVDFLKVEAEGYEPEVLEGMGDLQPKKVVVNVSPERHGQSTEPQCKPILKERGYTTRRRGEALLAWE